MINKLIANIKKTNAPIVVGLDPMLSYIPEHVVKKAFDEYGETLEGAAEAIWQFNVGLIDALCGVVPAVKPQAAYYENLGWRGMELLERTIRYAKGKGLFVIADIKRGDIGSTATAYAEGWLSGVPVEGEVFKSFDADCVTLNGYMGSDSIKPFLEAAKGEDKCAFVLVKTSNPSSGELQDKILDGNTVYRTMGAMCEKWGEDTRGKYGYSAVGAVVGATYSQQLGELRNALPHTFFLVPGYGAQGGGAKDVAPAFDKAGRGAVINSSRGIMCAYKKGDYAETDYAKAAREEAIRMRDEINSVL